MLLMVYSQWCVSQCKIISFTILLKGKHLHETEGVFVGHLSELLQIPGDPYWTVPGLPGHSILVLVSKLTGPALSLWFHISSCTPGIPNICAIPSLYCHLGSTNEIKVTEEVSMNLDS